jgi:hypothetical protein
LTKVLPSDITTVPFVGKLVTCTVNEEGASLGTFISSGKP